VGEDQERFKHAHDSVIISTHCGEQTARAHAWARLACAHLIRRIFNEHSELKDLFNRILVAQASVEGIALLTADAVVAEYPGSVKLV
jgi:PIN domain nuclease of toxin-antitoxin system